MVKMLTGLITMWIVWHCCGLFNSIQGVQMLQYFVIKGSAFLTVNTCQNTIDIDPFVYSYFCHSKSLLVWCNKCLAEFGKGLCEMSTSSLQSLERSIF